MFKDLIGNGPIKDVLRRFVSHRRVPNSLIFAGDEGVGKRQFALELAKALICLEPTDGEACDVCAACRRADRFTLPKSDDKDAHERVQWSDHPDVGTVIPYNRNILVKAVRHLETEANFRPYEARSRFFIIDDADKMNDSASNALLKTLEEPPATSHIFLICSRPDSMLATIRSRCQLLRFAPVESVEIERYLISERAFSHDEARLAASLAHGSVGRAVSINVEQMRKRREKMLGVVSEAIGSGDWAALLRSAEEINDAKNKDHFEEYMDILQSLVHDIWSIGVSGDPKRIVNTDLAPILSELARNSNRSDLSKWLADIDTVRQNLIVNINRKVATDAMFVSMAGS
ncbi:MAG: DNA polymerase III subunit delta' [Pyrinomonadaceae bacterium]|nr:DNA polymerase III subunit delta' [Pyrinomonadaceae bacterium]MBP6213007.1 DNA polymerase III subunit delta' [Pyrinomonadaceae bacterium]